jgi:hypothetical protein
MNDTKYFQDLLLVRLKVGAITLYSDSSNIVKERAVYRKDLGIPYAVVQTGLPAPSCNARH